jgi:4-amino-4-deoxy-L-arabinose transferase-like glycosyltransferase
MKSVHFSGLKLHSPGIHSLVRWQPVALYVAYIVLALVFFFALPRLPDLGDNYHGQAQNILEGKGFSDPSEPKSGHQIPQYSLLKWWETNGIAFGSTRPNQPTARCMPLYPLWLVFWFSIFGFGSPVVHVIQIFVMGLTIPLVNYIGRKLSGSKTAGFIAGLILLFHPDLLRYPGSFPSETLFIPLFGAGIAGWFWCREKPTVARLAIYAVVWGLAALTREMGIFYGLASLALLIAITPELRRYFYVPIIVLALLWTPWVVRNAVVMGEARLFPSRVGYNLWLAYNRIYLNRFLHARASDRSYPVTYFIPPENESLLRHYFKVDDQTIREYRRYDFPLEIMQAGELEINRALMQRARLFIREHPEIVVKFTFARLWDAFYLDVQSLGRVSPSGMMSLYMAVLYILGIAGFIKAAFAFRQYWYILALTGFFIFLLATGPWGARYRLPIDPVLAVFAGGLIFSIISRRDAKTERKIIPPVPPC